MWPYNDDESVWLTSHPETTMTPVPRLVAPDQISPELLAYHERRARHLRREAIGAAAQALFDALRHPLRRDRVRHDFSLSQATGLPGRR
jgi:hypothetical protein